MIIDTGDIKALFVHIPKTGGMSVERTIFNELHKTNPEKQLTFMEIKGENGDTGLKMHSTLEDYRTFYGIDEINTFYKFGLVRNPWRRMVSHYEFMISQRHNRIRHKKDNWDFNSFIQLYVNDHLAYSLTDGYDTFNADISTELDFVCRLENFNEDLKYVGNQIGLDLSKPEHINTTKQQFKDHINWKDYYTPGTLNMVYDLHKKEIEKYNYTFE